ncbi:MAG: helix-turn-helix transcriptional regulator [Betaproteobacteria bacterium]|nr:helix-turn-helix transcriptional regulator [Betaproteobacteria bacterium]
MNEIRRLLALLKRELKTRGMTYRDVAAALGLSEASVKRLFTNGRFTLERLAKLGELLDLSLAELMQETGSTEPLLRRLSQAQEHELVADNKLLLVAVCTLNHWKPADIVAAYDLDEVECLKKLLRLDKLRLIDLLPGERVRLRVARDFDWLPGGPIQQFFHAEGLGDFLGHPFSAGDEATFVFIHGMLTPAAASQIRTQLQRLRQSFSALHEEGLGVPLEQRSGMGLLVAMRSWELPAFTALRRAPASQNPNPRPHPARLADLLE